MKTKNGNDVMSAKFGVKLERQNSSSKNEISIRFYSCENIKLVIKDNKFFISNVECKNDKIEICPIFLDNNSKVVTFKFDAATIDAATIDVITFISVDKTNKEKYAIRVQVSNEEVVFTKMVYDED